MLKRVYLDTHDTALTSDHSVRPLAMFINIKYFV